MKLRLAEAVAAALVLPLRLGLAVGVLRFRSVGQLLSLWPGAPGVLLRRVWYRTTLERCGQNISVDFGAVIHRREARFGDDCYVGEYNRIGLVDVGDGFMSSTHVCITSGMHQHGTGRSGGPMHRQPEQYTRVTVGEDVWIGAGATVGADVAPHCIVAAGAVVTRPHDAWLVLGGVPARPLRAR